MKKVFIAGISGKMGRMLCELAPSCGYEVVGGFDTVKSACAPTFDTADKADVSFDVIIDFSRPTLLGEIIKLANRHGSPVVLATTGYDSAQLDKINALAKTSAVFRSANMSIGVAAAKAAAVTAKKILGDAFDIEIVEKHHNQKADSPSGTALLLADALSDKRDQIINRSGKRNRGEVGITSVRGGGVVGEHEIGFYGEDETVTITHSARSRRLFALGAFRVAELISDAKPGLYDMDDLVKSLS